MAQRRIAEDLSARRIIGFACNQGFVFFLFYMGANRFVPLGTFQFERADLFFSLAFMVVGFTVMRVAPVRFRDVLFSRPLLYVYAVLIAAGSLVYDAFPQAGPYLVILEGAMVGIPVAFLLTAWGRTFGRTGTSVAVCEVFIGSLVGALVCLAFSVIDSQFALVALRILPLASVVNIEVPSSREAATRSAAEIPTETARLSIKILTGTTMFGLAMGLLETYKTDPGAAAAPHYAMSMLVFGAFLIGSLSLLLSDGFGRGASLNKAYRLSILLFMLGIMCVPWTPVADSVMPGESFALAGYLGLEAVLISLFMVLAHVAAVDASVTFSLGFSALFAGELSGLLLANVVDALQKTASTPYGVVVLAGALALLSYIFLFTERDFDELSEIATVTDAFEDTCAAITERYKLSKRESEILTYALRGRTSERIASELTISKSTVETHLRRIYGKTGVHGRQELLDLGEATTKERAQHLHV